jgi:hypothetical protein
MTPSNKPSPAVVPCRALPRGAAVWGAGQVRVDIRHAPPTPAQQAAWHGLWRLLLSEPARPLSPLGKDDHEESEE